MSIFNSVGTAIGDGAKIVADGTKKAASVASLKSKLNCAKAELDKLYRDLGEVYSEKPDEKQAIDDLVVEINNINGKIAILEKKLAYKQGKVKCASCGQYAKADFDFCPRCGSAIIKEEETKFDAIKEKLEDAGEKIKDAVKDADLKEKFDSTAAKVKEFAQEKDVKGKITAAGEKVKNFAEEKEFKEKFSAAGVAAKGVAKDFGDKMGSVISDAKDYVNKKKNPNDIYDMEEVSDEPVVEAEEILTEQDSTAEENISDEK